MTKPAREFEVNVTNLRTGSRWTDYFEVQRGRLRWVATYPQSVPALFRLTPAQARTVAGVGSLLP